MRIRHNIAWYFVLRDRGSMLMFVFLDYIKFMAYVSVPAIAFNQLAGIKIPIEILILSPFLIEIIRVILGYLDKNYFKIWQKQNEISTRFLNPYFEKLEEDIEEIKGSFNGKK